MDIAHMSAQGSPQGRRLVGGRVLVLGACLTMVLGVVPPDATTAVANDGPSAADAPRAQTPPTTTVPIVQDAPTVQAPSAKPVAARQAVSVRVRTSVRGLDIPWDVAPLPNGAMLVTERTTRRLLLRTRNGGLRVLADAPNGTWAEGETGLMSVVADPKFRRNRRFYTCHGGFHNGQRDVRVVAWRMRAGNTGARRVQVLVRGMPVSSGRHGGCRLEIASNGALFVGTGDAALSTTPQNLRSLGGKVLRVRRFGGGPFPGNPYQDSANRNRRLVFTHGHRNVQGLSQRPGGRVWSVEHGTFRDDEVNLLVGGGDYGWKPGPGYDESAPMTDFSLPGRQRGARWSSGTPTLATSGAVWLSHPRWGRWQGRLAVASLKDESLHVMRFSRRNRFIGMVSVAELDGTHGRLRSARLDATGVLYITTSNGGGHDRVLRVVPS